MTNHALDRTTAQPVVTANLRLRHLLEFGAAAVAAAIIVAVAVAVSGGSDVSTPPVQAQSLRWEALVASEYPAASPAAVAEAARWTAMAEAYADYSILPQGQIAAGARLTAQANSFTQATATQAARLTGLAEFYTSLPPALQAAADRYQGQAEALR
ncbi:MAG: hypothetical protein HKO63_09705 [Acidimicrobiia bacterium]|nr:hypothetical protein [Acidimicrobiia bacterium]